VGTGQGNDLLVVETHSVEDDSKVILSLFISGCSASQTAERTWAASLLISATLESYCKRGKAKKYSRQSSVGQSIVMLESISSSFSPRDLRPSALLYCADSTFLGQQVSMTRAGKCPYLESTSLRKKSMEIQLLSSPCDLERFSGHISTALLSPDRDTH
jgi:hypothetical protein